MVAFVRSLVFVFFMLTSVAHAAVEDWTVEKASKQVNYTVDKVNWVAVRAGDTIPNQAWISTGPRGRLQLSRGVETLTFQPNTLAAIITTGSQKTELIQQQGIIDLDIEKRGQPHTFVHTPFLAAVVKGTRFRVSVTRSTAAVSVERGLVQVTSFSSGQRANLGPGQRASVDAARGMTVAGVTAKPSITAVAPSVARVPAVGQKALDGATKSEPAGSPSRASPGASGQGNGEGGSRRGGDRDLGDSNSRADNAGAANGNAYGRDNGNGNGNGKDNGNDNPSSNRNDNANDNASSNRNDNASTNRNDNASTNRDANASTSSDASPSGLGNGNASATGNANANANAFNQSNNGKGNDKANPNANK